MAGNSAFRTIKGLNIRKARKKDVPEVYSIEIFSFEKPYPLQLLLFYYYVADDLFLVAELENKVVGYVIGIVKKTGEGHVISLAVHPEFRCRGIGTLLMKQLLERMKRVKASHVKLEVEARNEAALTLYRKLGFREMGLLKDYYGHGRHAYIMVREL